MCGQVFCIRPLEYDGNINADGGLNALVTKSTNGRVEKQSKLTLEV